MGSDGSSELGSNDDAAFKDSVGSVDQFSNKIPEIDKIVWVKKGSCLG